MSDGSRSNPMSLDRWRWPHRPFLRVTGFHVLVASMMVGIFILDSLTPAEIAASILYVVPILITAATERPKAIRRVGGICAVMTFASVGIAPEGMVPAGWTNCFLSLVAISATTFLAFRGERAARTSRQAQVDLARLARILTVNEVSTTLAHEISQPLASIVANAGAAARWLKAPDGMDEARRALARACRDAERAGAVVDRVRRLVRRAPPAADLVDLTQVVEEALLLIRHHLDHNKIELRQPPHPALPRVRGDAVQMQQVVLNMLLNGVEALAQVKNGPRHLRIEACHEAGTVRLLFRDTGIGMSEEGRLQLFVPFHTTKADGVGVGLAISKTIIELHGGEIFAEPNHPRGAVFGFALPAAERSVRS